MNRKDQEHWKSTPGQKHAKVSLKETSVKRTRELLRIHRNQLRHVSFKGASIQIRTGIQPNL
jgi:hypothetical protein